MTQLLPAFAKRLLAWYERHGRTDLPWQRDRSCYRIWVAEVMLQQTQVGSVISYYERFLSRFPDVRTLADAPLDDVLALWSGLGYYARARNLHRAAQLIGERHGGRFPEAIQDASALPGIGRSTAGAILAQALGQRQPILDGNVKRVLCRLHAIDAPPGAQRDRMLWELAQHYTPRSRVAEYTQAIMDLGATVCTPRNPLCDACPFARRCEARGQGAQARLPARKASRALPTREVVMLAIGDGAGRVLLERRPPSGVWGGLWSLPQADSLRAALGWCVRRVGRAKRSGETSILHHTFSHYRLAATLHRLRLEGADALPLQDGTLRWWRAEDALAAGLPAPIRAWLVRHWKRER